MEKTKSFEEMNSLEKLVEGIKFIPKAFGAAATATAFYAGPMVVGIGGAVTTVTYNFDNPVLEVAKYGLAAGEAALGIYGSAKLLKPTMKIMTKIIYSGSWRHLRPSGEEIDSWFDKKAVNPDNHIA